MYIFAFIMGGVSVICAEVIVAAVIIIKTAVKEYKEGRL